MLQKCTSKCFTNSEWSSLLGTPGRPKGSPSCDSLSREDKKGVWAKHCITELKKHVFPKLVRPWNKPYFNNTNFIASISLVYLDSWVSIWSFFHIIDVLDFWHVAFNFTSRAIDFDDCKSGLKVDLQSIFLVIPSGTSGTARAKCLFKNSAASCSFLVLLTSLSSLHLWHLQINLMLSLFSCKIAKKAYQAFQFSKLIAITWGSERGSVKCLRMCESPSSGDPQATAPHRRQIQFSFYIF